MDDNKKNSIFTTAGIPIPPVVLEKTPFGVTLTFTYLGEVRNLGFLTDSRFKLIKDSVSVINILYAFPTVYTDWAKED